MSPFKKVLHQPRFPGPHCTSRMLNLFSPRFLASVLLVYALSWSLMPLNTSNSCYLSSTLMFPILTSGCVICIQVLPDYMAGYLLATHARSFNDPQVNQAEEHFCFSYFHLK